MPLDRDCTEGVEVSGLVSATVGGRTKFGFSVVLLFVGESTDCAVVPVLDDGSEVVATSVLFPGFELAGGVFFLVSSTAALAIPA